MSGVVQLRTARRRCDAPQHTDAPASDEPTHDGGDEPPCHIHLVIEFQVPDDDDYQPQQPSMWPWYAMAVLIGISL